jgi:hypothetical protein
MIPAGFTRATLLQCIDREIRLREQVYPKHVELGRMTLAAATRELDTMKAVRATLAQLPEPVPAQASLFGETGRRP